MPRRLGVGVIGMGGFARSHHAAVWELEREGVCKLVCTCTRDPAGSSATADELQLEQRGVHVFSHYPEMLNDCRDMLDFVCVPSPVPLHAEMHRACIDRGLPVYLEKPPTLDYQELEAMLEVEERAAKLTNVGFNFIIEESRQQLKRRLLQGEFGTTRQVRFEGLWPRSSGYYGRASWAGRLMLDDRLVLDSCFGNAMAHYIHNALFWAGNEAFWSWAEIEEVEAELYRAHDIHGPDTVFARARTRSGIGLRLALSHACDGTENHCESVVFDRGALEYRTSSHYALTRTGDSRENKPLRKQNLLRENLAAYCRYVTGEVDRPMTRLMDSKPYVWLNDLIYVAAGWITQVPASLTTVSTSPGSDGSLVAIRDLAMVSARFRESGLLPSELGVEWGREGGRATPGDISRLSAVVADMKRSSTFDVPD